MNFADRLSAAVAERGEFALRRPRSPDRDAAARADHRAPRRRAGRARAYERFCVGVIDAVADQAVAVKPQVAFFEAVGGYGLSALERIAAYAREAGLLVIADAKRGDIGSTASAYAEAWLSPVDGDPPIADAITVNPYMGGDSLDPFLVACGDGAGLFVLARTSNPGGADLQEAELATGELLWERTAALIDTWGAPYVGSCGLSAVGAVVGATHPEAVARARELMPRRRPAAARGRSAGRERLGAAAGSQGPSGRRPGGCRAVGDLRLARSRRRLAPGGAIGRDRAASGRARRRLTAVAEQPGGAGDCHHAVITGSVPRGHQHRQDDRDLDSGHLGETAPAAAVPIRCRPA